VPRPGICMARRQAWRQHEQPPLPCLLFHLHVKRSPRPLCSSSRHQHGSPLKTTTAYLKPFVSFTPSSMPTSRPQDSRSSSLPPLAPPSRHQAPPHNTTMKLSFVLLALGAVLLPTTSAMSPLQQRKNVAVKVSVQRGKGGEAFEPVPCLGGGALVGWGCT